MPAPSTAYPDLFTWGKPDFHIFPEGPAGLELYAFLVGLGVALS